MSSKVKWPERFPMHWQLVPAKWLFPESKKRAAEEDEQLSATQDYGVISQAKFMELAGRRVVQLNHNQHLRKRVEVDDFVISMRSFQGGLERAWAAGGIRSSYVILKPKPTLSLGYYQHLFKSSVYIQALQSTANFIRDGQDMSYQDFILIDLPLPPNEEQQIISAFLDYETTRIDRLIAQQQRLIELLKEKRQAVISHAVTKGLNPTAPMKDSGIEWLGQVPEHWVVSPLKYKCEFSGGGTPSKDNLEYWNGSIPWVSPKDMKSFWITDAEDKITEQAIKASSTKLVQPGAVLMVVRSGILQRTIPVGINTIPVTMNQDMKAIRFSSAVYAEWLSFFIKGYEASLLLDWRKQGATVESIEHEYLANSLMLFPPEEEARSIIVALCRRLDKFDQLEQRASDAITLLQERRTALISAAVTGKIDLRGWTQPAEEVAA